MDSRSIRGAIVGPFEAFGAGNELVAESFLIDRALPGCDMESDLLSAAGSMAGMLMESEVPPKACRAHSRLSTSH